jgi:hypothetical protein
MGKINQTTSIVQRYLVTINFAIFALAMHSALYSVRLTILLYEVASYNYYKPPTGTHAAQEELSH